MPSSMLARLAIAAPSVRRWDARVGGAGGVALLALWIARFAPGVDHAAAARACEMALIPLALVFGVLLVRAGLDRTLDPRARRAWAWIAVASMAWWTAGAIWELLGRPALSIADVVQLAFFPCVLAGVFTFPAPPTARDARVRFWLDTSVVVLSGAAAVWYFVMWPALSTQAAAPRAVFVNAAYPIGDLALLFAACVALVRRPAASERRVLGWLAAGLVARFAGDVSFGWETITASYAAGGLTDLTWLTAAWALAMGSSLRTPHGPDAGTRPASGDEGSVGLLPYVSVIALYGFLLATMDSAWGMRVGGVLVTAVAVTALVLARQYVASLQLVRLQRERGAAEAAHTSEARFRLLVQHSTDIIAVLDADGTLQYLSPSIQTTLGYAPDALRGTSLAALVHPDDARGTFAALAEAARADDTYGPVVVRLARADGEWRTLECLATNLLADPIVGGVVVNARDVTERALLQAQLVHQAFHDPLTGLANRALFRDRVEHALARVGRRRENVTVLFLDLDEFKSVNDSMGHAVGDRLLALVAERLLNATRGCDTVARLGGDEFAVLLENTRAEEDALIVADRVVQALSLPLPMDGAELLVGASVGLARARPDDGPDELLRNADVAMYRAKQTGKGRVEVFAPEMHAALVDRLELEGDLRRALADPSHGQFTLHFQPIVRLRDDTLMGVEALVRWTHPTRGWLAPAAFIPIAEASGLIVPLGTWVLREACRVGAHWAACRGASDRRGPPFTLTVNLSGRQLQAPGFVHEVAAALRDSGLNPASLVLEITETVIMQDTESNLVALHALKALGIRLAIDDFGTGYSSLSYLQRFPIDILKIDKSFVDGLGRGGSDTALARTIIALGDTLALRCIAEGVEDEAQRAHLQALGCDYAQGFLFARPMPSSEIDAMIATAAAAVGQPAA